jgi:N-acetylneuraminic acid mutarotase
VVDGKIYAIGGASGYGSRALRTVEEYDPATDTWTTKSEMPTARQALSTSVVNGKIYAIGGGASSNTGAETFSTVEEYEPATDTWTTKSEMPTARGWHSAGVVDGKIYVIGGSPSLWFTPVYTMEVYEPATDSWTRKGNVPCASSTSFASVVDGKIYAFGGYVCGWRVYEYDPVTDTWTRKADMPTYRVALFGSMLDGKIYAIGGHQGVSPYPGLAIVEVYDPATDTWTTGPDMPTGRWGPSTSVVDGKIYAIGGIDNYPAAACGTVEEYDPNPLVVDFNGDGIVDSLDMCIMVEYWHTDEPFYDIAPPPFGDGIVDVQDLIILSEHLFTYPGAVAYWKLDETEGDIAYDSAAVNDAVVFGGAVWQPAGGMVDGALQLDGVDDYVATDFILNPTEESFSIFAWIKGGAAGQVVLSRAGGANWLSTDSSDGNLITQLKGAGRSASPLQSQTVITNGEWHRIGLVREGSLRTLYVDGITVAQDTQDGLEAYASGLYIGTGKAMEPGSFWTGLIDDVRIYNRAVHP